MTRDDSVPCIFELDSKDASVFVCTYSFTSSTEDSIEWMRRESASADSRSGLGTAVVALYSSSGFLLLGLTAFLWLSSIDDFSLLMKGVLDRTLSESIVDSVARVDSGDGALPMENIATEE